MHETVNLVLPLLAIFAGILLNRADTKELRAEMKELRAEMSKRFDKVEGRFEMLEVELRYFHGESGKLDGRVQALEKK